MSKIDFYNISNFQKRSKAGALVIPFWKGKKEAEPAFRKDLTFPASVKPIKNYDFIGKEGETFFVYAEGEKEPRLVLLGLGERKKINMEHLRRGFSGLAKWCQSKKVDVVNLILPENPSISEEDMCRGIAEGLLLTNYSFETYKSTKSENKTVLLKKVSLIGAPKKGFGLIERFAIITEAVNLARDLVNGNADDITPQYLGSVAKGLEKISKQVKTTVFGQKRIEKEKMGLLLAVSRGSHVEPAFIIVEYTGDPKSKEKTVLVGKGVTYDTGGLNLKPTGSMEEMKCDMAGAATALGTLQAVAKLGLKVNLTAVIPATENAINSLSYKPGDIYTSYSGKTVEIGNTDAEGRLILADALSYSVKHLKPTRIVDFATLTGAIVISLGEEVTGMMANDDVLADLLIRAGNTTFERLCRLPIYEEYEEQLESKIADIKNVGGRAAGSITAALFLKKFVEETPWAHLDIAGTAYLSKDRRYNPKHASGIGVRLMVEFFEQSL